MKQKSTVFCAMSGGVDSSVAALLLKKRGFDVTGVYMKGWSLTGCAEEDARDARRTCGVLNIPFYVFNFENEFKKAVVDYMVSGYAKGETPNPDVMCNKEIKFGLFLKKALELGADYIATGHYARVTHVACRLSLVAARDSNKDQSYFLWTLTQEQLKHCLFPIGNYTKPQVRVLAKKYDLPTAEKPDSQGVCFVGEINVADFLKEKLGTNPGSILTLSGKKVGIHDGLSFYTIGQRRGIGVVGGRPAELGEPRPKGAGGTPYYVVSKNAAKNTLIVADADSSALFSKELIIKDINWISGKQPELPLNCFARIRYRQPLQQATLVTSDKKQATRKNKNDRPHVTCHMSLIFDEPQRAITPGQSAVFYTENGIMLGGGVIE